MGRIILFSPVGGTDPISETNIQDGSMLHICRYYKPDKVILYLSKEMLEIHNRDNRYVYCIEQLAMLQDRKIDIELIERPTLEEVQEFDFFYEEFLACIRKIYKEMSPDDTLLVNISSGTPAMKSGLLVLITLGEFPCKAIQVTTPAKRLQEHRHENSDIEILWDLNPDNENGINRCKEIKCPTLSSIKNEEIIKKYICSYDYDAALVLAESIPKARTEKYCNYIKLAKARLALDERGVNRLSANNKDKLLPIWSSDKRNLFEYALALDIKCRRGEYADFMRAFTPLFAELSERILQNKGGIDINDYAIIIKGVRKWDRNKLDGTRVLAVLNRKYNNSFKADNTSSDHFVALICEIVEEKGIVQNIINLRDVEKKIRNEAAHTMHHISDAVIKEKTGLSCEQIMSLIRKAFSYAGIKATDDDWQSYDSMNALILSKMEDI